MGVPTRMRDVGIVSKSDIQISYWDSAAEVSIQG